MNLQIAQVYLMHGDPALTARTWQNVMEQMSELKSENTLRRWQTAMRERASSRGRQGRRAAREKQQSTRWSRRLASRPSWRNKRLDECYSP